VKIVKIDPDGFLEDDLKIPAEILRKGGIVAFPTETVYGLGANALDELAVKRIFLAKRRPPDNPLIVHVSSTDSIYRIAKPNRIAEKLIEEFFPGPLTLVMEKREVVPDVTTAGLKMVAVRMPDHRIALKLIELAGVPVSAPSANKSGKPSPTKAEHVIEDFSDEIDCVVDGGKTEIGLESTVVDTTVYPLEILRPGAVTKEMIEEFFDVREIRKAEIARSPGMKYRHYSPSADVLVLTGINVRGEMLELAERLRSSGKKPGLAAMQLGKIHDFPAYDLGKNLEEYAERLFDALRSLDKVCDVIIVEGVEEKGIGAAIMNRLSKAGRIYRV